MTTHRFREGARRVGALVLWLACLPFNMLVGFPFVLLTTSPSTWRVVRFGILVGVWRPWIAARWRYSTTLGHGHARHERHLTGHIDQHERVHTRQGEDAAILAWVVGGLALLAGASWWLPVALVCASYVLLGAAHVGALLRGLHPYRDAEIERAAYAETDTIEAASAGRSWLDVHEERAGRP